MRARGEVVLSDELNHASIIDGCRLSRAETFVYRHRDTEHLEWGLRKAGGRAALIVTDGVFSMDGDVAPLAELAELADRHDCRLMVDEAHATGCIGPEGRGSVAAAGLSADVDVVMGTLGKALGNYGAYVCASEELTEYLVNVCRPFIFSTALPPSVVAGAQRALELVWQRPGRVERLMANARTLREGLREEGLEVGEGETQIVPLVVGDAGQAMALCEGALERGVFAQAIRPPTVPPGTSRLRMTAMATHRVKDLSPRRPRDRRGRPRAGDQRRAGGRPRARGRPGGAPRPRGLEPRPCGASSSPAPARRSARRWSRPRSPAPPRPPASASRSSSRRSAAWTSPGSPTTSCCAGPQAASRPTTRSLHTASARRSHRTSRPESRGAEIDPAELIAAARAAGESADLLVCEGVGGFLVPLTPDYLVRDLARDLGLPVVIAATPGLGTINHTLLTLEAVRSAGLAARAVVLTPWEPRPGAMERSNRETIAALGAVEVATLERIDPARPEGWPALDPTELA